MAKSTFDPVAGRQAQATGLLGGLFILGLVTAYQTFQRDMLAGGGPAVTLLPWLQAVFSPTQPLTSVAREFFDVAAIIALGFLFMVNWEFQRARLARVQTLGTAIVILCTVWSIAFGADWPFLFIILDFAGWTWTRIEFAFALAILAFIVPWFSYTWRTRHMLTYSPARWALRTATLRWLAGLAAFSLVLLVTLQHPFYQSDYYTYWRVACCCLYVGYLFLGLPYAFITNLLRGHKQENAADPGFMLLLLLRRGFRSMLPPLQHRARWHLSNRRIKTTLLDLVVKLFFVPLMVVFLFIELRSMSNNLTPLLQALQNGQEWRTTFTHFYGSYLHGIIVVDVSLGLIGYLSASRWLANKSSSVDPNLLGWIVVLACYPPFNSVTGGYAPYLGFTGTPYAAFQSEWIDVALKTGVLICFTVYVWTTACFGLRFSNLTDRGIITRGPYAVVRHPAYMMKNIAWWFESIRSFSSPWQFLFLALSNYIYYLRAVTEERHLSRNPDYHAYCKQVKYRFIPGVW